MPLFIEVDLMVYLMCSLILLDFRWYGRFLALTGLAEHAAGPGRQRDADHHQSAGLFPQKDPRPRNLLHQLPARSGQVAICGLRLHRPDRPVPRPSDVARPCSRAVTQGCQRDAWSRALQDAGNRSWFTVVEARSGFWTTLLRERQIIRRRMRKRYFSGEQEIDPNAA